MSFGVDRHSARAAPLVAFDCERHVVLNGIDGDDGCVREDDGAARRRLSLEAAWIEKEGAALRCVASPDAAIARRDYTQLMYLGVARLCLDCHEVHEDERCPACTSEAFAFITRWIKLENAALRTPVQRNNTPAAVEKIDTYRQMLQPTRSGAAAGRWLRNGGLLIAAGYVARWGWQIASRHPRDSGDERQKRSGAK